MWGFYSRLSLMCLTTTGNNNKTNKRTKTDRLSWRCCSTESNLPSLTIRKRKSIQTPRWFWSAPSFTPLKSLMKIRPVVSPPSCWQTWNNRPDLKRDLSVEATVRGIYHNVEKFKCKATSDHMWTTWATTTPPSSLHPPACSEWLIPRPPVLLLFIQSIHSLHWLAGVINT